MIGRLTGRVAAEDPTGAVVLDVGGVGYELSCPIGTAGRAARAAADEGSIVLYVHTNLRQDALELYGFALPEDRETFRHLIDVPGVGPRLALSILHVLSSAELARAIHDADRPRLERVPGVGKKTAERLVLELRGKLDSAARSSPEPTGASSNVHAKLTSALTGLGYRSAEAERAAKAVLAEQQATEHDFPSLLKLALKELTP